MSGTRTALDPIYERMDQLDERLADVEGRTTLIWQMPSTKMLTERLEEIRAMFANESDDEGKKGLAEFCAPLLALACVRRSTLRLLKARHAKEMADLARTMRLEADARVRRCMPFGPDSVAGIAQDPIVRALIKIDQVC